GVALRFYTPGLAPDDPDVFDYCPISCEHGDTLFSVQPVAPVQGDAKLAALRGVTERAAIALVAALLLACLVAPRGRWRWLVVLVAAWCMARAPIGYSLHMAEQFSPALFYRSMLGVFSASAGALTVLGVVALCAASVLWRRGLARRWCGAVAVAPVRCLARRVPLTVGSRTRRRARAGAASLGRAGRRDRGRHRRRPRHVGCRGGRSPRARRAGRSGTGRRGRSPRR